MRKSAILLILWCSLGLARPVEAIKVTPTIEPTPTIIVATVTPQTESIIDSANKTTIYRLESVLEKNRPGKWNGGNTIRKLETIAVDRGVAANTIVLLMLLPLIATLVSFLHYIVGLSGYGIFMPTMIAVAFLATGVLGGVVLFAMILVISLLSNWLLRKWKLHFWPARSINLLFISVGTFGLMVFSTYFRLFDISQISIFPILFTILLVEEFVRTQLTKSKNEAFKLTLGTLVLAIIGVAAMSVRQIQETVLLYPEVVLIVVLVINLVVGSYSGIRLTEIKRFKGAIRKKKTKKLVTSNK